jgi:hypothetical protein
LRPFLPFPPFPLLTRHSPSRATGWPEGSLLTPQVIAS